MVELESEYGRYGYRRIVAMLREEGWWVNHMRLERLWQLEGLKVPTRQPKRGRLWLTDGSCVGLRPAHKDRVWSYNFMMTRMSDGHPLRLLTVTDEFSRKCLAIDVGRRITSDDVLECLTKLFVLRGAPAYLRSDNGPEFTARVVGTGWRAWVCRRCTSSPAVPGRTATSSRSTASCGTNS
jgi:transposase InsO family protein